MKSRCRCRRCLPHYFASYTAIKRATERLSTNRLLSSQQKVTRVDTMHSAERLPCTGCSLRFLQRGLEPLRSCFNAIFDIRRLPRSVCRMIQLIPKDQFADARAFPGVSPGRNSVKPRTKPRHELIRTLIPKTDSMLLFRPLLTVCTPIT